MEIEGPSGRASPSRTGATLRPGAYLVGHEGGDGATDLVVVHVGAARAQQHEEEADRDRHLQHGLQLGRLLQPHEGHGGLVQELHAACRGRRGELRPLSGPGPTPPKTSPGLEGPVRMRESQS